MRHPTVDDSSTNSSLREGRSGRALAEFGAAFKAELNRPTGQGAELTQRFCDFVADTEHCLLDPVAVSTLLDAAQLAYLGGQPRVGLRPCELAVSAAVLQGNRALQRKALTFEGILLADAGNVPLALERYSDALGICHDLGDTTAEAAVLVNLGSALINGAVYQDAIACLERAVGIIGDRPELAVYRETALANIALAALHIEDLAKGLRAAKASVSTGADPLQPMDLYVRVLSERNYARLLLEVENLDKAKQRSEIAKVLASRSGTKRAELAALLIQGLYEVHAGLVDVGLSRLKLALDAAQDSPPTLRDTLIAMVKACEAAGRPDEAVVYLHELRRHTQEAQAQNALYHHRIHLAKVEGDPEAIFGTTDTVFRRHERLIEGQQAQQKLLKAQIEQLERLAVTAELRDDSTGEHSYRVGRLAALLAREAGLDEQTCFTIDLAARLHDIGKIGIPDGILLKPGHLNAAEREIMETHTTVGAELLAKSDIPHMQVAEDIARFHHEWWAGGGYPAGISGEAIPIAARVTALADVFDALTHKRPYKEPWPVARALDEIQRLRGSQFDPKLTDIFITLIHRLQREVGDLDEFLGAAARESSFNQARSRIAETLRRNPERRGYDRGLDPRL